MSKAKQKPQRPLAEAMTPDERRLVDDLMARLKDGIAQQRAYWHDVERSAIRFEQERDKMVGMLPAAVREHLSKHFDVFVPEINGHTAAETGESFSDRALAVARSYRVAAEMGFFMAVIRYRKWLVGNREVEQILHGRDAGQRKGHATQSQARENKYQRIRETWAAMEAAGEKVTNDTVAEAVGCSRSTVIRAFKSKPTRRTKR